MTKQTTIVWANSADASLKLFQNFFFLERRIWHIFQIVILEDILLEMSYLFSKDWNNERFLQVSNYVRKKSSLTS